MPKSRAMIVASGEMFNPNKSPVGCGRSNVDEPTSIRRMESVFRLGDDILNKYSYGIIELEDRLSKDN